MLQLEPTVADERWLKESIVELSPIETSCKTTFDLMVTLSPKVTLPSKITLTSTEQSLPASTSPRTSIRAESRRVIPCSIIFQHSFFLKLTLTHVIHACYLPLQLQRGQLEYNLF